MPRGVAPGQRVHRDSRRHRGHKAHTRGARSDSQRDRDRLIYTSALRRLAGVTQVAGAVEGHVFHNRLTHTLKVAQIARRLAERLAGRSTAISRGGIDPEVVEAAALAHDLGHPPFGHVAEHELDRLVKNGGDPEGYEGNAQSFRIVTKLAAHHPDYPGLDLTRATLNAILKYPWPRALKNPNDKHYKKFGYYTSEDMDFAFARAGFTDDRQSVEAAIMDVADAIAYSVHDLDDFFRAGLVPVYTLRSSPVELQAFLSDWKSSLNDAAFSARIDRHEKSFVAVLNFWPAERQHVGSRAQRRNLRWTTSKLIDRYVKAVRLTEPSEKEPLRTAEREEMEIAFLQRIVRRYVIDNPRLATQQAGQTRIISYLYHIYYRAIRRSDWRVLPSGFVADAQEAEGTVGREQRAAATARVAADIVAALSDSQASLLYRRISGVAAGSVSDILDG